MYPKQLRQLAVWAVFLTALAAALALLTKRADAQETPCPWPTSWAPAYATEVASTHRQTLIMRPACVPVTPAPAVAPALETSARADTSDAGILGLPHWYVRTAVVVGVGIAVFLDILRRRALAARRQPRTLGEQMGVYERGGGGDNV